MKLYATTGSIQVIKPKDCCRLFVSKIRHLSARQSMQFLESSRQPIRLYKSYHLARMHAINLAANKADHFFATHHPNRHNYYMTPIFTVEVSDSFLHSQQHGETISWASEIEHNAAQQHRIKPHQQTRIDYSYANLCDIDKVVSVQFPHINFKNMYVKINKSLIKQDFRKKLSAKF